MDAQSVQFAKAAKIYTRAKEVRFGTANTSNI